MSFVILIFDHRFSPKKITRGMRQLSNVQRTTQGRAKRKWMSPIYCFSSVSEESNNISSQQQLRFTWMTIEPL